MKGSSIVAAVCLTLWTATLTAQTTTTVTSTDHSMAIGTVGGDAYQVQFNFEGQEITSEEISAATFKVLAPHIDGATGIATRALADAKREILKRTLNPKDLQRGLDAKFRELIATWERLQKASKDSLVEQLTASQTTVVVDVNVPGGSACVGRARCSRLSGNGADAELYISSSVISSLGTNVGSIDQIVFRCIDASAKLPSIVARPSEAVGSYGWIALSSPIHLPPSPRLDLHLPFRVLAACENLAITVYLWTAQGGQRTVGSTSMSSVAPPVLFSRLTEDGSTIRYRETSILPAGLWRQVLSDAQEKVGALRVISGERAVSSGLEARDGVLALDAPGTISQEVFVKIVDAQPWHTWVYQQLRRQDRWARDGFCEAIAKNLRRGDEDAVASRILSLWLARCDKILKARLETTAESASVPRSLWGESGDGQVHGATYPKAIARRMSAGEYPDYFIKDTNGERIGFVGEIKYQHVMTISGGAALDFAEDNVRPVFELLLPILWGYATVGFYRGTDSTGADLRVSLLGNGILEDVSALGRRLSWMIVEAGGSAGVSDDDAFRPALVLFSGVRLLRFDKSARQHYGLFNSRTSLSATPGVELGIVGRGGLAEGRHIELGLQARVLLGGWASGEQPRTPE